MAGTIIDALVVTLGLDATGFKKGQKEVGEGLDRTRDDAEQTAKDMEVYGKKASSFFTSIGKSMLALAGIALSANGVKSFISDTTKSLVDFGVQASAIDTSAKALDGWAKAAEASGSSAEAMTSNLQKFQNSMSQFNSGFGADDTLNSLFAFSAQTGTKFDTNQNGSQIMQYLAENWNKLDKTQQRYYGQKFNFDNAQIQALSNGSMLELQRSFEGSSKQTEALTEKGRRLLELFVKLNQSWESSKLLLFSGLEPGVKQLVGKLGELTKWIESHGPAINRSFAEIGTTFSILWKDVSDVSSAVGDLLNIDTNEWSLPSDIQDLNKNLDSGRHTVDLIISAFKSLFNLDFSAFGEKVKSLFSMGSGNPDALPQVTESANSVADWMKDNLGFDPRNVGKSLRNAASSITTGQSDAAGDKRTLADRNNNPGNIRPASGSGFRVFESASKGWDAMKNQLLRYFEGKTTGKKLETIIDIVKTWAPASDKNDPDRYAKDVSGWMGISEKAKIDLSDSGTLASLMQAMARKEGYSDWASPQAHYSARGGEEAIMGMMNGQRYAANVPSTSAGTTNINFQNTTIKTDARDMQSLAKDAAKKGMSQSSLTQSFMTGQIN